MGTRSIVMVTGNDKRRGASTTRIYKHHDGYPSEMLPMISEALTTSRKQHEKNAERFKQVVVYDLNVSQVVGNVIAATVDVYGMGAHIDTYHNAENPEDGYQGEFDGPIEAKHFGRQSDLEWMYVINLDKREVRILGGGFTGEPADTRTKELANPFSSDVRDGTKIAAALGEIEKMGFKPVFKKAKAKKTKVA